MASELLVDEGVIEDGGRLATELVRSGFDVAAAFWVRTQEDGLWLLYIASDTQTGFADAYRTVYASLGRLRIQSIGFSQIKLIRPANPIAVDVIALRDRYPARIPTRVGARRLGNLAVDEAYIYPRIDQAGLTRNEVVQAVAALMRRTGAIQPSSITLRNGETFSAIPLGIQISQDGQEMTVTLHEYITGKNRVVAAEDIAAIQ